MRNVKKYLLKTKNIHIAIIIIGIIFNCISIFHPNLWFDEAYSVGLADKSFVDIWKIGGNDVHPVLYYWILHIIYLIAHTAGLSINGMIICYRIFSALCISLLGIIGYTHIKKDFGEKVGLFFSFFSYFMPAICIYTAEVRMYSLAILLVTLLAIYAYRIFKQDEETNQKIAIKNWIIFGITSLACIYVHYYGLMAAGIINCVLLFYFIKKKKTSSVIKILISGVIQLILYIPWIMYFMRQLNHVSKGFWIKFIFPKSLFELVGMQFSGNLADVIGFAFAVIMYIYLAFKIYKTTRNDKNENNKIAIISIIIYISVIIAAIIITKVLKSSILYYRYLFVITGLLIFFISYFLSKEKNKYVIGTICTITVILAIFSNYKQITENYDKSNMTQISYLKENIKPDDVIVYGEPNFTIGGVISLHFTDNKQIYYNPSNWGVDIAYKAFGNQLDVYTNTDFLKECKGRVWIIDPEDFGYYDKLFKNENFKLLSQNVIRTSYESYVYNIILVEYVGE